MAGICGVASRGEKGCVDDLFFITDYHFHLGTVRGGLAVRNFEGSYTRFIHDITNSQFRSKFEEDIKKMKGLLGIGVISDTDSQPLIIGSSLGDYAIVTVGKLSNIEELVKTAHEEGAHFRKDNELGNEISPTDVTACLINKVLDKGGNFEDGIQYAQERIKGSCSMLLLTPKGIYCARDKLGRTPLFIGKKDKAYACTFETTALPNLGFELDKSLGPGEIIFMTPEGIEQKKAPEDNMQICSFLWVYYGYPSSSYEGINVELARKRCGIALAKADLEERISGKLVIDSVAGIPDSGTSHAHGYANQAKLPFERPIVKYTPTWSRSFMPQEQKTRELVAEMKLIPVLEFIRGQRLLFCEDSIVRGTQLQKIVERLFYYGAKEVHMRPACPPLVYGCKFLNFSRSKSEAELASRKAIRELRGADNVSIEELKEYADFNSEKYSEMVERIKLRLGLTSLKYQKLDDLVNAIGLPKKKLCTYCWDGCKGCEN